MPPPAGYWDAIQKVLDKHDILLIADEVVTGFGRSGSMFGSDHYGMKPDIITIAKGLTSAYAPLSGSIVSDKVWKVLEQGTDENGPIGHGWTYSAHPIGAAAGVANLKLIDELNLVTERGRDRRLSQQGDGARRVGGPAACRRRARRRHALRRRIREGPRQPRRSSTRPTRSARSSRRPCSSDGVIARAMPQGDILGFAPPFCLTEGEADEIAGKTAKAASKLFDWS